MRTRRWWQRCLDAILADPEEAILWPLLIASYLIVPAIGTLVMLHDWLTTR